MRCSTMSCTAGAKARTVPSSVAWAWPHAEGAQVAGLHRVFAWLTTRAVERAQRCARRCFAAP